MSAAYKEFSGLNLPAFEAEILAKWTEKQAFEKESEKQIIREMMSGALSEYYTNKLKKEAILKPKSEIKKKIETELSAILSH